MSFSNDINKELSELKINSKLEALLELSSLLKTNASISIRNAFIIINFITESQYVGKRVLKLLEFIYSYQAEVSKLQNNNILKDGVYNIKISDQAVVQKILDESGIDLLGDYVTDINILYKRIISIKNRGVSAYLRGLYLGSGSMVNPKKSYNLEFILTNNEDLELAKKVLEYAKIYVLYKERKDKKIIYIKNSEIISDFLNIIKANKALLELENIKVKKDLRNNINRRMNFDMANLNKTIKTSLIQIEYIEKLLENNKMPEDLIEIANLRKENPDLSLKQLGELVNPIMSKSSVAYKMDKIKKLAKKLDKSF